MKVTRCVRGSALLRRRIEEGRHHDGRAAQMGDAMLGDRLDRSRPPAPSAGRHACPPPPTATRESTSHCNGTSAASTDSTGWRGIWRRQHIAVAHQRRAAMMIDHALGIAGGARGVIQRNRVPFVARHLPGEIRIAACDEGLIILAQAARRSAGIPDRHSRSPAAGRFSELQRLARRSRRIRGR